eukprot:gene31324-6471_t
MVIMLDPSIDWGGQTRTFKEMKRIIAGLVQFSHAEENLFPYAQRKDYLDPNNNEKVWAWATEPTKMIQRVMDIDVTTDTGTMILHDAPESARRRPDAKNSVRFDDLNGPPLNLTKPEGDFDIQKSLADDLKVLNPDERACAVWARLRAADFVLCVRRRRGWVPKRLAAMLRPCLLLVLLRVVKSRLLDYADEAVIHITTPVVKTLLLDLVADEAVIHITTPVKSRLLDYADEAVIHITTPVWIDNEQAGGDKAWAWQGQYREMRRTTFVSEGEKVRAWQGQYKEMRR